MYKVSETVLPIYINGQCPIIKTCSDVTLNLSSKDSIHTDIENRFRTDCKQTLEICVKTFCKTLVNSFTKVTYTTYRYIQTNY